MLDIENEDFAVADPPRPRSILDRFDHIVRKTVLDHDFDFYLGQKIDHIFGSAIEFCVALLAAEAFDFSYSDSRNSNVMKCVFHVIELERLDDGLDLLHGGLAE